MTAAGRGWWAIGSLTAAVLATTLAVPSLIPAPDRDLGLEVDAPALVSPTPAVTSAAPPPSPSAVPVDDGLGRSPTPAPAASTSAPPAPPPSPTPVFKTIKIAATDPGNERFRVEATDCPTCASGSRIQYLGVGQTLTVHVRGVLVAGRRQLTIYYTCGGDPRPLDVIINNGDKISLELAGNDSWIDPATVTIPIDLPAGDTEIRFFHATESSVDLDQIVIA
ncbi:hypothetical protein ACIA8K_03630 [Catenuloplanes sp. NPDC051500]|uniref:hypothetical protein n=1 Tax=Catenuloplanes sp. NPDC051500 TaxID=3363959 RepID=UPI0037A1975D